MLNVSSGPTILFDQPIEGSLKADGTEQDMILDQYLGNPQRFLEGYIDLSLMQAGDSLTIRQYIKIQSMGSYGKYAEEIYTGTQVLPLLYITSKPGRYGIRITTQQNAGALRTFPYQFFRKRVL